VTHNVYSYNVEYSILLEAIKKMWTWMKVSELRRTQILYIINVLFDGVWLLKSSLNLSFLSSEKDGRMEVVENGQINEV